MKGKARAVQWFLALLLLWPVAGQSESDAGSATLYLYPESDGSIWVDLCLRAAPADPSPVTEVLAEMLSIEEPGDVEALYDGEMDWNEQGEPLEVSWSGYLIDALARSGGLVEGELDFDAIRPALAGAGAHAMRIEIYLPEDGQPGASVSAVSGGAVSGGFFEGYALVCGLEEPLPRLRITYGFTGASLLRWYASPLLVLVLYWAYLWFLRRSALRQPAHAAGAACFACTRGYVHAIIALWAGLVFFVWAIYDPAAPLPYVWEGLHRTLPDFAFRLAWLAVLAVPSTIAGRLFLFRVYERYPDSSWMRTDFVLQSIWGSAFVLVLFSLPGAAISNLVSNPSRALALIVVAFLSATFFYRRLIRSLGFVVESIEEGPLRERVDAIADQAGIARIAGVYMLRMTRTPIFNAFAANRTRVLLTDFLLRHLTRREVDAIIAHEVTHLKHRHPERLHRFWIVCYFVLPIVFGLFVNTALVFRLESADIFLPAFQKRLLYLALFLSAMGVGHLLYLRRSRRFERVADSGGLALVGDPEAQISSLSKITRMSHMPMVWGRPWQEGLVTHPSTFLRAHAIGKEAGLSEAAIEAHCAGASTGDDRYPMPEAAGRLFSTEHKMRVVQSNSLLFLLFPGLVATALLWLHTKGWIPMPAALFLPGLAALTIIALLFLCNRIAMSGFRNLARQMRDRHAEQFKTSARVYFVAFCPNDSAQLYDGFTNWDVGLLAVDEGGLHYVGDAVTFTVPRAAIAEIAPVRRIQGPIPAVDACVTWRDDRLDNAPRVFCFHIAEAFTLTGDNRATHSLVCSLRKWLAVPAEPTSGCATTHPLPPLKLEPKGQHVADVYRLWPMMLGGFSSGACAFAIGHAAGLPGVTPFAYSAAAAAGASFLAIFMISLPGWWYGLRHNP
ncbi:MAG: M48 family metalloprotease [Candidatus Hydrogenedentes bacterium]|nr:M48 family metalloprotease [Candidatus Hydrogenedentota bacterium]